MSFTFFFRFCSEWIENSCKVRTGKPLKNVGKWGWKLESFTTSAGLEQLAGQLFCCKLASRTDGSPWKIT